MKGHVRRKGDRWYAVIYEGIDPVTGKEHRSWHAAGTERANAERLAAQLAAKANGRRDETRALTLGTYLQSQWLPAKKAKLRPSTYAGYRRNVKLHILPTLGRVPIRRLRDKQLESLYKRLAHPTDGTRALSAKTVLEIHLIIRAALADALRDEYVTRNVALTANVPQPPSVRMPYIFTDAHGVQVHPHSISQAFERIAVRAEVPLIRLHDLRHTHATLLIKAGVPVKVVSERLGHAKAAFTIETYQHVLPGMQADAARTFEQLVVRDVIPGAKSTGELGGRAGGRAPEPGTTPPYEQGPGH
jgi:integrase